MKGNTHMQWHDKPFLVFQQHGNIVFTFCIYFYILQRFYNLTLLNSSILSILVLVSLYLIYHKTYKVNHVKNSGIYFLASSFSLCTITGIHFSNDLPFGSMNAIDFILYLLCILGSIPLCAQIFGLHIIPVCGTMIHGRQNNFMSGILTNFIPLYTPC